MTLTDLQNYLSTLPEQVLNDIPDIIAETATEFFKETFTEKASPSKKPWAPLKKEKHVGSLMVTSGNLMNSPRPAYVGRDKVIISAGNDKVPYAQTHNEGFTGPVLIPAHTRTSRKGNKFNVAAHTINQKIPQREFMANSIDLTAKIKDRINNYLRGIL